MLSFFKSKPKLAALIPEGYVDIHSHILPGIDDGAKNIEESNYLMKSLLEIGISKCITTPHTIEHVWDNTRESIIEKFTELQQLSNLTSEIQLEVASEYMINETFMRLLQDEKLLTLKGNFVLVEMSYISPPIQLYEILFQLQLAGYKPILAHPERYTYYHSNFTEYEKLKKAGCYFQLNLLSVVGYYGPETTQAAEKLLQKGMIDFTGTDVHHSFHIKAFQNPVKIKSTTPLVVAMQNNSKFN